MVNTRSGSGVDQPAVPRQGRSRSSSSAPQQPQMDPTMQAFLEAQTQLLQTMNNNMANMQAQLNQNPNQPQPQSKHREFMSHHPPVFSHAADPLDAEDWLKTVQKMLVTSQCSDREKVLYTVGRLQGSASAWWDAYVAAHATPETITWQEFTTNFRSHHI